MPTLRTKLIIYRSDNPISHQKIGTSRVSGFSFPSCQSHNLKNTSKLIDDWVVYIGDCSISSGLYTVPRYGIYLRHNLQTTACQHCATSLQRALLLSVQLIIESRHGHLLWADHCSWYASCCRWPDDSSWSEIAYDEISTPVSYKIHYSCINHRSYQNSAIRIMRPS